MFGTMFTEQEMQINQSFSLWVLIDDGGARFG